MTHITLLLLFLVSITMQTSYSPNLAPEDVWIRHDKWLTVFSHEKGIIYGSDNVVDKYPVVPKITPIPVTLAPLLLADQITQGAVKPTQDQLEEIAKFLENGGEENPPAQSTAATLPVIQASPAPMSLPQATTTAAARLVANDEHLRRDRSSRRREMPQVASDDYAYLRTQKKARFFDTLKQLIGYVFGYSQS